MDELLVSVETSNLVEFLLDEVLYSLHVVVGHLLDVLHALCVLLVEVEIDAAQCFKQGVVEVLELRQWQLAQCNEIFDFYAHSVTDECIL